jgi:hypothetical protein
MNISSIAFIAFVASSISTYNQVSSFTIRPCSISVTPITQVSTIMSTLKLQMISTNNESAKNVVSFTTTIHREEVDLESLTIPQLKQMHTELQKLNESCTEECTQTNPECDIELKDERDSAMIQIQSLLNERDTLKNYVDMNEVTEIVKTPWAFSLKEITRIVNSMESLNCECTEEGNQTNMVCDVQLKDERDTAIETLNMYMTSVNNLVSAAKNDEQSALQNQDGSITAVHDVETTVFDMSTILDCVNNPGSKSVEVMQIMLIQLEAAHNACTEDATQTNIECDIEIKAERDLYMISLVSQIHDAKICMNQIKAFANQDNIDSLAIDDVMNTVINTIPNLPSNHGKPTFTTPTDDYLIQI